MNASTASNPFPRDTVVKNSIEQLPDFRETKSYQQAVSIVENFRENFPIVGSVGTAMGIRGRFGSGKTHLVFQLIQELQASERLQSVSMYAKADKVDFLDLYVTHFAGRLSAETLKKAVSLHFAKLLRVNTAPQTDSVSEGTKMVPIGEWVEGSEEKSLTEIAREEVDRLLATDPSKIIELVEQDLLPISGLNRDFAIEIETTERGAADQVAQAGGSSNVTDVSRDFFRAYSKLTDKDLGPIALRWIQGAELTNAERQDLGLETARISQASAAKQALRFLLGAFKKADFAVLFCLDEFERFSSRGTTEDLNASAGLLKDLAETFQQTGHLLVISGMDDAWNKMPKDVFARIKPAEIVEMSLSEPEAIGLIDAYCRSSSLLAKSVFESRAITLLYEASNHNTRRVLDLSHEAYEIATDPAKNKTEAPSQLPVKEAHVEQATNSLLSDQKRRDSVDQAIETVAHDLRLPIAKDFNRGNLRCDYLLGDPDRPQVVIQVTKSIFKVGEISAARELATLSQSVHKSFSQASFCVVIIGYSTKEVRDALARVVDRVFAFDEDNFPLDFREFVKTLSHQPREVEERLRSQESAYQDLLSKFDTLERARFAEIDQLKLALESLQSESIRMRETAYEKRVTDKMGETLNELNERLAREEGYAFRHLSREGKDEPLIPPGAKGELVFRLIDEQNAYVRRAEILNERLPQAAEFSMRLLHLEKLLAETESIWRRAIEYAYGNEVFLDEVHPDVRELYRDRKRVLTELEGLHYRRASFEGGVFGKFGQAIRQNKIATILSALAIIGVALALYSLYSGWSNERTAITYSSVQLSQMQSQVQLADLDPEIRNRDNVTPGLLQIAVSLETVPFGRTYVVRPVLSWNVPEIKTEILMLRNDLGLSPSFAEIDSRLNSITNRCRNLQQQLEAISFSRFAASYISANRAWFIAELLPAALLVIFLMMKGFLRRIRHRRMLLENR